MAVIFAGPLASTCSSSRVDFKVDEYERAGVSAFVVAFLLLVPDLPHSDSCHR